MIQLGTDLKLKSSSLSSFFLLLINFSVHSLMWTHFTLKLINGILWKTKPFLSWTEEEIMGHTVKGFFPDLTDCSSFERPRSVEDIIIVEGIAQDAISSVKFIAPCHLPRHVQFINLIRKDKYMVNPQLFFIPLDASLYDSIMTTFKSTFKKRVTYLFRTQIIIIYAGGKIMDYF